jgi:hypothetical protein
MQSRRTRRRPARANRPNDVALQELEPVLTSSIICGVVTGVGRILGIAISGPDGITGKERLGSAEPNPNNASIPHTMAAHTAC